MTMCRGDWVCRIGFLAWLFCAAAGCSSSETSDDGAVLDAQAQGDSNALSDAVTADVSAPEVDAGPDGSVTASDATIDPLDSDSSADPAETSGELEDAEQGQGFTPCDDNEDCFSGFCVPTPEGNVCTKTCDETCPEGWACKPVASGGSDVTYICVFIPLTHCDPCESDASCDHPLITGQGARCLVEDPAEGAFCRVPCDNEPCPAGSSCRDTEVDGQQLALCFPDDGVCGCSALATLAGATTTCERANAEGRCTSERVCTVDGLSDCLAAAPEAERCDGVDNNCDGQTDEGLVYAEVDGTDIEGVGQPCGLGACSGGVTLCDDATQTLVCSSTTPEDDEAECDGVDNDCDGQIDEGFVPVESSCGDGPCAMTGLITCESGALVDTCVATQGAEVDTSCDGVDDDCDGVTDDDFVAEATTCSIGACTGTGNTACVLGEVIDSCEVDMTMAQDEMCNGIDDDCDGTVDLADELPLTQTCFNGPETSVDLGACKAGFQSCVEGSWSACEDEVLPVDEVCNGVDDDCDGASDEGFDDLDDDGVADCVDDDLDGDTVSNADDNCPEDSNLDQADSDMNGVGDACDNQGCAGTDNPEAIRVNSAIDTLESDGLCSLREAIQAANSDTTIDGCNAGNGADVIVFEPALSGLNLTLQLPGNQEDDNQSGDLDIKSVLVIEGCGATQTIIHGASLDRVFHVHPQASLTLRNLTVTGGVAQGGAGTIPAGGQGAGFGGGIYNASELILDGVSVSGNLAIGGKGSEGANAPGAGGGGGGGAGLGGGIYNASDATASLSASTGGCRLLDNAATGGDGGKGRGHGSVSPYTGPGGGGGGPDGGNAVNANAGGAGGFGGGGAGGGGKSGGSAGGNGGFSGGGGGGGGSVWGGNSGNGGVGGFAGGNGGVGCCSGAGGGGAGGGLGGGLFNDGGVVTMQNCSLSNNQAIGGVGGGGQFSGPGQPGQGYGGGLFDNGGTTLLEEVTFVGNVADTDGDDSYTSTQ